MVPTVASDAATTKQGGIGAVYGDNYLREGIPEWLRGHHINELELYGILRGFQKWAHNFRGKFVVLLTDSSVAMWACRRMSSPIPNMNKMLMELASTAARYHVSFSVQHIAGMKNKIADALSRDRGGFIRDISEIEKHDMVKEINLADVFDKF